MPGHIRRNEDEVIVNDNSNIPNMDCRKMMDLEDEALKGSLL